MKLDGQVLEAAQAQRVRRARRTAAVVAVIAVAVFALAIGQMFDQHHPHLPPHTFIDSLLQ